jgi:4-hydroxy-3-methylbut-2-enyl diphosphate reductase
MLSGESLAIATRFGQSWPVAYGEASGRALPHLRHHLLGHAGAAGRGGQLLEEPLDLMLVVGGYNSSNTCHLAALCREPGRAHLPHRGRRRIDPDGGLRHQPVRPPRRRSSSTTGSPGDAKRIGITAGASTPNNKIGETVLRLCAVAGVEPDLPA